MKIERSILAAILAALYLIVKQYFPDIPITEQGLLLFALWAAAQLGVEVTAPAVRSALIKRGFIMDEYSVYESLGAVSTGGTDDE